MVLASGKRYWGITGETLFPAVMKTSAVLQQRTRVRRLLQSMLTQEETMGVILRNANDPPGQRSSYICPGKNQDDCSLYQFREVR